MICVCSESFPLRWTSRWPVCARSLTWNSFKEVFHHFWSFMKTYHWHFRPKTQDSFSFGRENNKAWAVTIIDTVYWTRLCKTEMGDKWSRLCTDAWSRSQLWWGGIQLFVQQHLIFTVHKHASRHSWCRRRNCTGNVCSRNFCRTRDAAVQAEYASKPLPDSFPGVLTYLPLLTGDPPGMFSRSPRVIQIAGKPAKDNIRNDILLYSRACVTGSVGQLWAYLHYITWKSIVLIPPSRYIWKTNEI